MSDGDTITIDDLSLSTTGKRQLTATKATPHALTHAASDVARQNANDVGLNDAVSEELSLEDYFQRFVLENQDAMNETELAQKLGISRKCLWERRQRFDLPRKRKRGVA